MRIGYFALSALLVSACATTSPAPSAELRAEAAPTGPLRLGIILAANHATKDPATGELKGIAVDLGREAARRLGVSFEPVPYSNFADLWAGLKSGAWDMATLGITEERSRSVDFTSPYMTVEYAFLVPAGSSIATPSGIDRPGVRVGVLKQGAPDQYLSAVLRQGRIVPAATVAEMVDSVKGGAVDALYGTRAGMLNQVPKLPGSRVLDEAFGGEGTAIAVPKGRPHALSFAGKFVQEAKAEGLVKRAIDRTGLAGIVVAP